VKTTDWLNGLFGKGKESLPLDTDEIDRLQGDFLAAKEVTSSKGGTWLISKVVQRFNEKCLDVAKGGHTLERYSELAGEMRTLMWLYNLPGDSAASYSDALKDLRGEELGKEFPMDPAGGNEFDPDDPVS